MIVRLVRLTSIALFLLLISCITTSRTLVSYDVSSLQDGKTIGSQKCSNLFYGSYAPAFKTTIDVCDRFFDPEINSNLNTSSGVSGYSLTCGLTKITDLGFGLNWGLSRDSFLSFGGKLFLKQQVLNLTSGFSLSTMVIMGYAVGSSKTDDIFWMFDSVKTTSEIFLSSNLTGLELHLPMSFKNKNSMNWYCVPKCFYFYYHVPIDVKRKDKNFAREGTKFYDILKKEMFCPAISFGWQSNEIRPEITFIKIERTISIFAGLGIVF